MSIVGKLYGDGIYAGRRRDSGAHYDSGYVWITDDTRSGEVRISSRSILPGQRIYLVTRLLGDEDCGRIDAINVGITSTRLANGHWPKVAEMIE